MKSPLKTALFGLLGIVGLLVIWSFIEPRILNTTEEVARIPNLPPSWRGKRVGQLSDFQIGLWGDNPNTARRGVAELIEAEPDLALISGDFIYHPGDNTEPEIETAVDIVRPLVEAGIPTYAVLGNHDYGMSSKKAEPRVELAERLATELEAAGIEVLSNEAVQLESPEGEQPLYLVGVDSLWANRDNVDLALSEVPDNSPRISMMHNPDTFEQFPASTAPFAMAGHTHGGQVRIPGTPQWSYLAFTQKDEVKADGWTQDYGEPNNQLYVNVGIGMSIAPIRLFCPPELTLFTLENN